ncbi:MAG: hypothetical protein QOE90_510 [Thermoplasmata archaeon]|jgi:hypothetical protein|nr:hypothetical protein [Thermoplasmata archaeon]
MRSGTQLPLSLVAFVLSGFAASAVLMPDAPTPAPAPAPAPVALLFPPVDIALRSPKTFPYEPPAIIGDPPTGRVPSPSAPPDFAQDYRGAVAPGSDGFTVAFPVDDPASVDAIVVRADVPPRSAALAGWSLSLVDHAGGGIAFTQGDRSPTLVVGRAFSGGAWHATLAADRLLRPAGVTLHVAVRHAAARPALPTSVNDTARLSGAGSAFVYPVAPMDGVRWRNLAVAWSSTLPLADARVELLDEHGKAIWTRDQPTGKVLAPVVTSIPLNARTVRVSEPAGQVALPFRLTLDAAPLEV